MKIATKDSKDKKIIKHFLIRTLIIFIVILLAFSADQLTKYFLYDKNWDIKIVAGARIFHKSTTFLDYLNIKAPFWTIQFLAWFLFAGFLTGTFFVKSKFLLVTFSVIIGGILGNTFDQLNSYVYNNGIWGVRDIFTLPWSRNGGIFNLSDQLIIFGAASIGFYYLVLWFIDLSKPKYRKKLKKTFSKISLFFKKLFSKSKNNLDDKNNLNDKEND